jgi:molecular chaperone IbpA
MHRASVGFDSMFDRLNQSAANLANSVNYPPHNIVKHSDSSYTIEVAVAGFKENELDVSIENNVLTISGSQQREDRDYLYQGISSKSFQKVLNLADHVVVRDAVYENGMLVIGVEIVVPEELKPRKIGIVNTTAKLEQK